MTYFQNYSPNHDPDGRYEASHEVSLPYRSPFTLVEGGDQNVALPSEQLVMEAKQSLAQRYSCTVEDFVTVSYGGDAEQPKYAIVYAKPNGVEMGDQNLPYDKTRSFDAIMADGSHSIVVGNERYDTRSMTFEIYEAFIQMLKDQCVEELPDSYANKLDDWGWYTWTYVFDPDTKAGAVRVFEDGSIYKDPAFGERAEAGDKALRLRPTIILSAATPGLSQAV